MRFGIIILLCMNRQDQDFGAEDWGTNQRVIAPARGDLAHDGLRIFKTLRAALCAQRQVTPAAQLLLVCLLDRICQGFALKIRDTFSR